MADRRPPGFNVDIGFYDSDEVLSIPRKLRAAAVGVWTLAGAYSANKLTDGYVPAEILKVIGCTAAIRAALCSTQPEPLWTDADTDPQIDRTCDARGAHLQGICFTRWPKWQRTRAEVKAYMHSEAQRKRNARAAARGATTSDDAETSARTNGGRPQNVRPDDRNPRGRARARQTETKTETKKDNSLTLVEGGTGGDPLLPVAAKAAPTNPRGTRLPDDWRPRENPEVTGRHLPGIDIHLEYEKFCDYWRAQPGIKGRKTDWEATWRNWLRRAAEQAPRNGHDARAPSGVGKATEKALGYRQLGAELINELHGNRP